MAVSRGHLAAQRKLASCCEAQAKISIIALIAANLSLKGPCCLISQQARQGVGVGGGLGLVGAIEGWMVFFLFV